MSERFSIEAVFKAVDKFTNPVKKMENQSKRFTDRTSRGIERLNKQMQKFGRGMRGILTGGSIFGASAGMLAKDLVNTGMQFEKTMVAAGTNFGKAYRRGSKEMNELIEKSLRVVALTEFTPEQLSGSTMYQSQAGLSGATVKELLDTQTLVDFATVSSTTLDEATNFAISALGAFNKLDKANPTNFVNNLVEMANLMAYTANKFKVDIPSMMETIKMAGPVSVGLMDQAEFMTMLGILGDAGITGTVAGTGMKNLILQLSAPTSEGKKQLEAWGIKVDQKMLDEQGFAGVLAQLGEAKRRGNLTDVQFRAGLKNIMGKVPIAQGSVLSAYDTETMVSLIKELDDMRNSDYFRKIAGVRRDTAKGGWDQLVSAIQATKIKIFDEITYELQDIFEEIASVFQKNSDKWAKQFGNWFKDIYGNRDEIVDAGRAWLDFGFNVLKALVAYKALLLTAKASGALMALGIPGVAVATAGAAATIGVAAYQGNTEESMSMWWQGIRTGKIFKRMLQEIAGWFGVSKEQLSDWGASIVDNWNLLADAIGGAVNKIATFIGQLEIVKQALQAYENYTKKEEKRYQQWYDQYLGPVVGAADPRIGGVLMPGQNAIPESILDAAISGKRQDDENEREFILRIMNESNNEVAAGDAMTEDRTMIENTGGGL